MADELNTQNFKDFLSKNKIVVVDFWAEWCGPCKIMAPVFEEVSKELTKAKFAKLDVDANADVAAQYEVSSIPTVIIYHEGKEVERIVGFNAKPMFKAKLQGAIKKLS